MAGMRTIDFSPFMVSEGAVIGDAPTPEQVAVSAEINDAFRGSGFVFLDGIGITSDELDRYYEMSGMLFALPDEHKKSQLKQIDQKSNSGFSAMGVEGLNSKRGPDLKELYNIPNPAGEKADFSGCPPEFREDATAYWDKMKQLSNNFAIASAIALELPRDYFLKSLQEFNNTIARLLYYPPCDYADGTSSGDDISGSIRSGEHTDFGMFTFLFCDGPGLQVKAVEGGEIGGAAGGELTGAWLDVPVPTGTTVIVNTGALMARWTNDVWRATAHRVIVSNQLQAMSHRFSVAFFVEPDAGVLVEVHPCFVKEGEKPKYEPITSSDYLMSKLAEIRPN